MVLSDVNILIFAHRAEAKDHSICRSWLEETVGADRAFGVSDLVLSGFLRIVTNPRIFQAPTSMNEALGFVEVIRSHPHAVTVSPGPRHWNLFTGLCRTAGVKGGLVPDAYLAALAIESGCELITADRDFARFPGLRWRHPVGGPQRGR